MAKTDDLLALMRDEPAPTKKPEIADEIVRKLALLNPSLKGGDSTDNFVLQAHDTLQKKETPKVIDNPLATARNTDQLIGLSHERYEQERKELELQLSLIQTRLAKLKSKHLDELCVGLHRLDANLSSPITQAALKDRKPYLDKIGFTPVKLIESARRSVTARR